MTWRLATTLCLVCLVIGIAVGAHERGRHDDAKLAAAQAQHNAAQVAASEQARKTEQDMAARFAAQAQTYEEDKAHAQATADRVAADLRTGNLRLREQWRGCEARRVPGTAAAAGEPDAGADVRAAAAGRVVRAGAACDAQVRGLQELLRQERM